MYYRDRLITIRDYLVEHVQDHRFNLDTWAGNDNIPWLGDPNLSCGTTACVMGHAATIPEFQRMGLRLEKNSHGNALLVYNTFDAFGNPVRYEHFRAAVNFLNISRKVADYLFSPDCYDGGHRTTKQEVIERINDLLKDFPHASMDPTLG